jgi:hypothetical protein
VRFLAIDPANDGGRAQPWFIREKGYDGVRFVAFPDRFDDVAYYVNEGLLVQLVIARESGDVEAFAEWFRADDNPDLESWFRSTVFWVVGNEPDGPAGGSSWTMTPAEYRDLWARARCLHGERWVAGMCSGNQYVAANYLSVDADEAGVCVHPYGKTPRGAVALVKAYAAFCQTPVWVGEFFPTAGHTSEDYFAAFEAAGGVWAGRFCYSDAMVSGFGLESAA